MLKVTAPFLIYIEEEGSILLEHSIHGRPTWTPLQPQQKWTWALKRVVVSQNEFWDLPLAYLNVFFNFGVGSFSSTFGFGRFLWWKMGFQNSYFAIKVKISKCSK